MHDAAYTQAPHADRQDWRNLRRLGDLLAGYRGRIVAALAFLLLAKIAGVAVPVLLKAIVDRMDAPDAGAAVVLPVALLLGYGALKLGSSFFNELRDMVFARVRYGAMRVLSRRVLEHLHRLSLRFHLERHTGAISRDLERGTRSLSTILNYLIFNILPTAVEFLLIAGILLGQYPARFALVALATVAVYMVFTFAVTDWRMHFRHEMNALDSEAGSRAVESLINYETVKYFGNERLEEARYDDTLRRWEGVAVRTQNSMGVLNFGQGAIIAVGMTVIMFFAADGVAAGTLTLGDLVLVNAFLLQLFVPLNFLGIVYRQLRHAFADMDLIVRLLDRQPEIRDAPDATPLVLRAGEVRFERVGFAYQPERPILHGVDFTIAPGETVAVVGPSGAGKSTLARLLFRFYDVTSGTIRIDGQDIRGVTQESLRAAIGIVPQDTVLFNDTLRFNLAYARPGATDAEIARAAQLVHLDGFLASLPEGDATVVGERGLKLSGGERQRVAIARVILKGARILVFDEATSSLDSRTEQAIQQTLGEVAAGHSALVIAHRLSTIAHADRILVLDGGTIVEQGTHAALIAREGLYARMWRLQQQEERPVTTDVAHVAGVEVA